MALPAKFAFATVMDVEFTKYIWDESVPPKLVLDDDPVVTIESLRISNLSQDGPQKEYKGGKAGNTLIRYGKEMRLEMEDVFVTRAILENLLGMKEVTAGGNLKYDKGFSNASFQIKGTAGTVDSEGVMTNLVFTFHDFRPDELLSLNMEAEGDFGVIALSGELFPDDTTGEFFTIEEKE